MLNTTAMRPNINIRLNCGNSRNTALNDATLLRCDLLQGITKMMLMIDRHRRYYGNLWLNDIRRIQPTTQAGLDNG